MTNRNHNSLETDPRDTSTKALLTARVFSL